jgi:LmbE family N-acetylglucosaminyl deacetylase
VTILTQRWNRFISTAPSWIPPDVDTLVVVPHPDDESLSVGGLIATQRRRGRSVRIVAVTDGEAAYPSRCHPDDLARLRRHEQDQALATLGVASSDIVRLGLPDGGVAAHEDDLAHELGELVRGMGLVVGPWQHDHHTDHEATGRATERAARGRDVTLAHSLFWAWHHTDPELAKPASLVALDLDDELFDRRREAIACHRSQLTDVVAPRMLHPDDIESATWAREHYMLNATT